MDRFKSSLISPTLLGPGLALLMALAPTSAPAKDKEIVAQFITYELVSAPTPADSANGITFELQGLWGSPNDVPGLFGFSRDELIAARIGYRQRRHLPPDALVLREVEDWFAKDPQGLRWINPFLSPDGKTGLFAFRVTVHNNADQPLRMRDARLYLQGSASGEAISPSSDLDFYDQWMLAREVAMNNRKEGPLAAIQSGFVIRHVPYPVGIAGAILAQKVPSWGAANLMENEVPPGASGTGFLLFPVEWGAEGVVVEITLAGDPGGRALVPDRSYRFQFRKVLRTYRWDKAGACWALAK